MKKTLLLLKYCLTVVFLLPYSLQASPFDNLLKETSIEFKKPDNFKIIPIQVNELFLYEYAIRENKGKLEIRYAIRPIARMKIDYKDPHNAAPEPNHLFPLLFDNAIQRIAQDGHNPRMEYSPQQSKEKFNSDWASASAFDVKPEFSDSYKQGLLLAMHKSTKADAYAIFLFNDYHQVKELIDQNLTNLKFSQ